MPVQGQRSEKIPQRSDHLVQPEELIVRQRVFRVAIHISAANVDHTNRIFIVPFDMSTCDIERAAPSNSSVKKNNIVVANIRPSAL